MTAVRPGRIGTPMQAQLRNEDLVGPALAVKHRGWQERGELLDPSLPARLVVAVCAAAESVPERVVSSYDDAGRRLLGTAQ